MNQSSSLAIVLAAGKGTRMNQEIPKPLVPINGKPIISWIVKSFADNDIDTALVVNPKNKKYFKSFDKDVELVFQEKQKGTGHAVLQALELILKYRYIYVFVGDSPFIGSDIILDLYDEHTKSNSDVTILTSIFDNKKFPYARIIRNSKKDIIKVVEELSANEKEKKIDELFGSHYLFKSKILIKYLTQLEPNKVNGEIYFTDILNVVIADDLKVKSLKITDWRKLVGLNSMEDIKWAESQKIL
ncbi:MAG: UDP-N-acetylglucosamine pyrophosphorylase [Euryarchaeota archaeon]|nr:UDP-N-acetylglucosamine pyrophosphorylase [Euryarchaeota archaeon]|tara:strand:- start:116 stop:847 length:732 start_codon:yes stop_codon:yes gene_type:complete